jgi:hypothetical protein
MVSIIILIVMVIPTQPWFGRVAMMNGSKMNETCFWLSLLFMIASHQHDN